MTDINKLINQRYPTIQIALGAIDFSGKGSIYENDLLKFYKKFHLDFTEDELHSYFARYSLIDSNGRLDKAMMAKIYYRHHFRNNFETPGLIDAVVSPSANQLNSKSMNELNTVVSDKLKHIEKILKTKIASNWNQVRRAFLDIDSDYDGYITSMDLFEICGGAFDVEEIKLLMKYRGADKDYKIDFKKFSSWLGATLTPYEGFFFRHDSLNNPEYSLLMKKK